MRCDQIEPVLTRYLLGDLDKATEAAVREHLSACEGCRAAVRELEPTLGLLRNALAAPSHAPERLSAEHRARIFKARRRDVIRFPLLSLARVAALVLIGFFVLAGLFVPNLARVRERACRVNAKSNLHGIWTGAVAWGLDPRDSFRDQVPRSLDVLVSEGGIPKEMLVDPETGNPVEYYGSNGRLTPDRPLASSRGKGGRTVVFGDGRLEWFPDGKPIPGVDTSGGEIRVAQADAAKPSMEFTVKAKEPLPPPPRFHKKTTRTETKEVQVSAETPMAQATSTRLTVDAPSSYVQMAMPMVAPTVKPADIKIMTDSTKKIEVAKLARRVGGREFQESWKVSARRETEAENAEEASARSVEGGKYFWASGDERRAEVGVKVVEEAVDKGYVDADMDSLEDVVDQYTRLSYSASPGLVHAVAGASIVDREPLARGKERFGMKLDDLSDKELGKRQLAEQSSAGAEARKYKQEVSRVAKAERPMAVPAEPASSGELEDALDEAGGIGEGDEVAETQITEKAAPMTALTVRAGDIKIKTDMSKKIESAKIQRLMGVRDFQAGWKVQNYRTPSQVMAEFIIFQAKYQNGDWNCSPSALPNLMLQVRAWSKDRIKGNLYPKVLDIGTDQLFALKPPFVYLTGDKDFRLLDTEVRNIRDYLMLGGAVWADSALPGRRSRFDIAFRREMKRVMPDRDFEIVATNHPMFNTFFKDINLPAGMNYYQEPAEIINIGGEVGVIYTLNGYGRLWENRLNKDGKIERGPVNVGEIGKPKWLHAYSPYLSHPDSGVLFRNISDEAVRNAYEFGINVVVHLLTRYQKYFQFLPDKMPKETELGDKPVKNKEPKTPPKFTPAGINPFVDTKTNPFSTFAIDVDTASYTLTRNYMLHGTLPPPEAVRTEEFVNFFDYGQSAPRDRTFAVYAESAPTPFARGLSLLKIGVKGRHIGREEGRPAILTFLIDTSGSMSTPDRMGLVKQALRLLVERLGPNDRVAIVQYDSSARLVLEHTAASEKARILETIDSMQTSGSTNLEEGMKLAYEIAARGFVAGASNRVLLLSDGAANLGSVAAEEILKSVERFRKQGIYCSVYGVGMGTYDDTMLETLANKGDGSYVFMDSMDEARRVFVDELGAALNVIASDVKIQVEFNPGRVKSFRQMGYENRRLRKEDFRDDKVDAGEVGSGQSVTALYELELNESSREPIGTVRIRYRDEDTGRIEEISQPLNAGAIHKTFEDSSVSFRLACSVAAFAEILRGSPYVGGTDYEDVARVLRPVALDLGMDSRVQELLRLVQSAGSMPRGN